VNDNEHTTALGRANRRATPGREKTYPERPGGAHGRKRKRAGIMDMQTTFDKFMQKVEQTTDILEIQNPHDTFPPKPDTLKAQEVAKQLNKTWDKVQYKADFDTFLSVILAALERREEDYMNLIGTLDRDIVNGYGAMYGGLMAYFIDGYYGDPLGTFYMKRFSYGNNGEYFTP